MSQALLERVRVLDEDLLDMRAATARTFMTGRVARQRKPTLLSAPRWRTPGHGARSWLTEIDALERAWLAAALAAVLFCGALALAEIWDRVTFFEALHQALITNLEYPQLPDDVPVDAEAAREP